MDSALIVDALMVDREVATGMVLDDVHSFVLRVGLNRAHGGGNPRPQFQLEHVNRGSTFRASSLEQVLAQLRVQVDAVFNELGYHDGC